MHKETIIKVRKDNRNRLVEFLTDLGNVYDYEMAKELISREEIINAELFTGRDGLLHIKGKNDQNPNNNLSNLPEF